MRSLLPYFVLGCLPPPQPTRWPQPVEPAPSDRQKAAPPAERETDEELVEKRWGTEEARARRAAQLHASEHRRAQTVVLGPAGSGAIDSCAAVTAPNRGSCPLYLYRNLESVEDLEWGVRLVYQASASGLEEERHLRRLVACQREIAGQSWTGPKCPLWMGEQRVHRANGHVALEITVGDPEELTELRAAVQAIARALTKKGGTHGQQP